MKMVTFYLLCLYGVRKTCRLTLLNLEMGPALPFRWLVHGLGMRTKVGFSHGWTSLSLSDYSK